MLKFGIYNKKQLRKKDLGNFWNKRKFIAIDLYPELKNIDKSQALKWEEIILKKFSLSNGVYKRTSLNRFPEFNQKIINFLNKNFPKNKKLKIHDTAVSDGRTAVDFFHQLLKNSLHSFQYYASDKDSEIFIYQKGRLKIARDEKGNLLQIIFPPFVFNTTKPENSYLYPLNKLVKFIIKKVYKNFLKNSKQTGVKKIKLFSYLAIETEKKYKNFQFLNYDLTKKTDKKFDVIRAMNVLNTSYFKNQTAQQIINNLKESLEEEGLLIIGSNQGANTRVDGAIFKKTKDNNLKIEKEFGNGPQFKELF